MMEHAKPEYETLPRASEQGVSQAATEVNEPLMGNEIGWTSSKSSFRKAPLSSVKPYLQIVNTLLLGVIVALLVLLRNDWKQSSSTSPQVGGDYNGVEPTFALKTTKWNADATFIPETAAGWMSNETLATWNTLMPVGARRGEAGQPFSTTSMTHQLHCLFMMGRIYSGVESGSRQGLPKEYGTHYYHCIDYLRQAIMCSADLALERHDEFDPDDLGPLDGGWSGLHVCKDYDQVKGYLAEQIASNVRVVLPIDD